RADDRDGVVSHSEKAIAAAQGRRAVTLASLALFAETTESNAAYFIDPRCRRSVAKPQNRHSGGICPHPPDHRSPSPKGWLQIVNQTAGFYSTKMTAMSTSASITCFTNLARALE